MGTCRQFTPELKRKTVQLLASVSRSASPLACELGVRHNQLYTWQREFQPKVPRRFRAPVSGRHARQSSLGSSVNWPASRRSEPL